MYYIHKQHVISSLHCTHILSQIVCTYNVYAFNVLNQQTLLAWIEVKVTWFPFDGDMGWRHRREMLNKYA